MTPNTWQALQTAAHRIAQNNYRSQLAAHLKAGRKKSTFRMTVTPEHAALIDAMGRRPGNELSDNDAMALLHEYETFKQRIGKPPY